MFKNTEFEEYFQYYDYPVEENAVLSRTQFCDELQNLYNSSIERFQYYMHQPAGQKLPKILSEFRGYLNAKEYTETIEYFAFWMGLV